MGKKGAFVWIFSSMTFVSSIHFAESVYVLVFGADAKLFQLYPFIGERLLTVAPTVYFWTSAAATFVTWGITCAVAFENPVEQFLNKILSDARKQTAVEAQLLEDKSEVLDAMYDTIESDNQILSQVKDLMCNVRADAREIQPIKESLEKVRTELSSLRREFKRIEEKMHFPNACPTCGKPLLPEFKMCPYCGEQTKPFMEKSISLKEYR